MYRKDVLERISYEMKKKREKDPDGLNYAQIARDMGCDYQTVKAAVARIKSAGPDGQGAKGPSRPPRPSVLDGFRDAVRWKVDGKCKVSAIFRFIKGMGYEGGLTTLKVFCKEYRDGRQAAAKIRFETSPGVQRQVELPLLEEQDVLELLLLCVPSVHIQSFLCAQTVQTLGNTSK